MMKGLLAIFLTLHLIFLSASCMSQTPEIESLRQELQAKEKQIVGLQQQLNDKDKEIAELEQRIQELQPLYQPTSSQP